MKKFVFCLALALSTVPAARAQVGVHIDIGLPAQPQVVEVEPGVRVVEGIDEEVFYSGGWYWCRHGDGWYRARSPRAHFYWVDRHRVPGALARMPEGRYRGWRRADHPEWHGPRGGHGVRGHEQGVRHDRGEMRDRGHAGTHEAQRPQVHEGQAHGEHHDDHR